MIDILNIYKKLFLFYDLQNLYKNRSINIKKNILKNILFKFIIQIISFIIPIFFIGVFI